MKHTYIVLHDDQIVATSCKLAVARKHRKGVYGRRIVRLDRSNGVVFVLRDFRGGTFHATGVEVT
jgi:hypothetical protein